MDIHLAYHSICGGRPETSSSRLPSSQILGARLREVLAARDRPGPHRCVNNHSHDQALHQQDFPGSRTR